MMQGKSLVVDWLRKRDILFCINKIHEGTRSSHRKELVGTGKKFVADARGGGGGRNVREKVGSLHFR